MSETQIGKPNGSAGRPVILSTGRRRKLTTPPVVAAPAPVNTPGKPNSALKENPDEKDHYRFDHPAAAHVRVIDPDRGIVEPSGRRNIAICGFASSSRGLVPVNEPTWEVWGLNQLYRHIPRADRWFDIHENWAEETVPGTDYVGWIRDCGIPFYMARRMPELPTSVTYPVERLCRKFNDYFTSTIAFMLALAIDEIDQQVDARIANGDLVPLVEGGSKMSIRDGITALYGEHTIGIFGVDLVVGEEYFWQKSCAEWWIGIACSRGIRVMLPPQTALCKQLYRYGYEKEPSSLIRVSEIQSFSQKMTKERDEFIKQLYLRDGALQAAQNMIELIELRQRGADVSPRFI